jgi:hypothetical protein
MVVMSAKRQGEVLNELAEAIGNMRIPDAPNIHRASVEPYLDADGEAALKAVIIVDAPDENGWSAEFTHTLRRQVNRLAAERHIDEHVYVSLFTQDDFEAREDADEPTDDNGTRVIDQDLIRDQQDRPSGAISTAQDVRRGKGRSSISMPSAGGTPMATSKRPPDGWRTSRQAARPPILYGSVWRPANRPTSVTGGTVR